MHSFDSHKTPIKNAGVCKWKVTKREQMKSHDTVDKTVSLWKLDLQQVRAERKTPAKTYNFVTSLYNFLYSFIWSEHYLECCAPVF